MGDRKEKPYNAPIVEAVINFDCDLPPTAKLEDITEKASPSLKEGYPDIRKIDDVKHTINETVGGLEHSINQSAHAVRYTSGDKSQIVQYRTRGYSFNRLAPYTSLDDYLGEIQRTWNVFLEHANPAILKRINMRYINEFIIPVNASGGADLEDYITTMPCQNGMEEMNFAGIFQTIRRVCPLTKADTQVSVGTQGLSEEGLKILVDIDVSLHLNLNPKDFLVHGTEIKSLRDLKNKLYYTTTTKQCQNLFQQ